MSQEKSPFDQCKNNPMCFLKLKEAKECQQKIELDGKKVWYCEKEMNLLLNEQR